MTGDFTRNTFDPTKNRSSVRHQQGRVLLDAEWNEQRDIDLHDARRTRTDVIGPSGGPIGDVGLEIGVTVDGAGLTVGAGTYYVDGIRFVEPAPRDVEGLPAVDGDYLVYVDVWERFVNAVEDPTIREVALGGPDTTGRTVVTHRIAALPLPPGGPAPTCGMDVVAWDLLRTGSTGAVSARVEPAAATVDPCLVPETAGYKGLENQLVRVEIHDGNLDPLAPGGVAAGVAVTFKWAKDNASIVGSWSPPNALVVPVERLGPGGTEGFVAGRWVEFTNDDRTATGQPGIVVQVDEVVADGLRLVDRPGLSNELTALHGAGDHPLVRRWDSAGPIDLQEGVWLDLTDGTNSDGIQVRFEAGRAWRSGDHWLIPARTAILPGTTDRHIDWPVDAASDPLALPSAGPAHHQARLALARRQAATWQVLSDCRDEFAPLTELITFVGRGGDGQHARPGHWLPAPLRIGVSHGALPLADRDVRFRVDTGGGVLVAAEPEDDGTTAVAPAGVVDVRTNANGEARVWWRVGDGGPPSPPGDVYAEVDRQVVRATLLDAEGAIENLAVRFFAQAEDPLILVAAGGDGQMGWPGETLEIAPRARVTAGRRAAVGQLVEFEVMSTMDDGTALDEFTGGSIHATAGAVSTTAWPGGSRMISAVVATDDEGVAQVQWILGTDRRLPVQRLYAHLLGDDGERTGHYTIFTAHLGTADEIMWRPCKDLAPLLPPGLKEPLSVQHALDVFCELFVSGSNGRLQWPQRAGLPLNISSIVDLADFPTIVLELAGSFDDPPNAVRSTLLEVSVPGGRGSIGSRILLDGRVRVRRSGERTRLEWTIGDGVAQRIRELVANDREVTVLVTLRPAMLGRSSMFAEWSGGFRVRVS